ncbi:class I SAM-dependent methyltransferase [Bacillus taeanensis]|uniref:SAM-dependent methyltransferase n=1 Tax=Bacillus taeanensis TaxID=273032 RepID=A0A366XSF6_9BACI|nr:class I SAM-dependent methyltransferase [Bacillus taeanensis]RBW68616.1 SAM-dependent methyltransferase [Bacillus taeanensis]
MKNQHTKDDWNANLYDQSHSFVSKHGNDLLELLAPKKGEKILDLGCGTGDLANQLHKLGVHVIGIDKSDNMISEAQSKYPHIKFIVSDITELEWNNEFDAVFSNAVLHWVKSPKHALESIYYVLKKGGRFTAEFGGKGNVRIITNEIINQFEKFGIDYKPDLFPWYFPSIGEYASIMEKCDFRVILAQHFDRPTHLENDYGLRNWIEMFAGSMFSGLSETMKNRIIDQVESNLKENLYHNGRWIADYKRIRVIGVKE